MAQVQPNEPSRPALLQCTLKFSSYLFILYHINWCAQVHRAPVHLQAICPFGFCLKIINGESISPNKVTPSRRTLQCDKDPVDLRLTVLDPWFARVMGACHMEFNICFINAHNFQMSKVSRYNYPVCIHNKWRGYMTTTISLLLHLTD